MSVPDARSDHLGRSVESYRGTAPAPGPANLADILERVLDKVIVIAGDITINLLDIELLTIKVRLLVASVDKAREMGINWWEGDPSLSLDARDEDDAASLEQRLKRLEEATGVVDARERPSETAPLERSASDGRGDEAGE